MNGIAKSKSAAGGETITRRHMCPEVSAIVAVLLAAGLVSSCSDQNTYVGAAAAQGDVAARSSRTVTPISRSHRQHRGGQFSTDLVARVPGFVQEINYKDGDLVKKGTCCSPSSPNPTG